MKISVLGTGSGGPFHGRHFSAQLLQCEGFSALIDCGEGTQMQLFRYRKRFDACNHIFITHLHGDHVFGLIGLLTNWCLKKRTEPLFLFSPPGLKELVGATAQICKVRFPYELNFIETDPGREECVFENDLLEVWTIPLHHRTECNGWLFREKIKPKNMRKEAIDAWNIHYSDIPAIKAGADYVTPEGTTVPNEALTYDPPKPASFAYCSDTAPSEAVVEAVRGVDLLYHEATFTEIHAEEAAFSFHSTAMQAAEIAARAGVGKLLLGHFSGRYSDTEQHLLEARAVFPESYCAEEGGEYEITAERLSAG